MNELHASFTSLLASLAAFDATIKEANATFRAALRLDGPPVPAPEAQPAEVPALALPIVEDDQPATPPATAPSTTASPTVEATPPAPAVTTSTTTTASPTISPSVEVPAVASVEVPVPAEGPGVAQDATVPETTAGPTTMPTTPPATVETAGQEGEGTAPIVPVLADASGNGTSASRTSGGRGRRGK